MHYYKTQHFTVIMYSPNAVNYIKIYRYIHAYTPIAIAF